MIMGFGEASLFVTQKGTEELRNRAHKLDLAARNILFLIERGSTSADAILRRSVFPRDKVIDKLRRLMSNEFVAVAPDDGGRLPPIHAERAQMPASIPRTHDELAAIPGESPLSRGESPWMPGTGESCSATPEHVSLEDGISIPQARFVLSDFCLDHLEEPRSELAIAIKRCADVTGLQQVLDRICHAIQGRSPDRLSILQGCVREINQTNI
jgi:hypothetical protein